MLNELMERMHNDLHNHCFNTMKTSATKKQPVYVFAGEYKNRNIRLHNEYLFELSIHWGACILV